PRCAKYLGQADSARRDVTSLSRPLADDLKDPAPTLPETLAEDQQILAAFDDPSVAPPRGRKVPTVKVGGLAEQLASLVNYVLGNLGSLLLVLLAVAVVALLDLSAAINKRR